MTARSRRALTIALGAALAAGLLAVLRPWTIVPIERTSARTFDAEQYVASVWASRVLPVARSSAVELEAFMQQPAAAGDPARRAVFVSGTARVSAVDRTSRVGVALLQVSRAAGDPRVVIQIGPVLRGTALRDALEFIQFTDFVNQLEFASVANALNARVLADVIGPVDGVELAGREVAFVGAVPVSPAPTALEIVPVELRILSEAP
jgi:predicted lipoprotein